MPLHLPLDGAPREGRKTDSPRRIETIDRLEKSDHRNLRHIITFRKAPRHPSTECSREVLVRFDELSTELGIAGARVLTVQLLQILVLDHGTCNSSCVSQHQHLQEFDERRNVNVPTPTTPMPHVVTPNNRPNKCPTRSRSKVAVSITAESTAPKRAQ